MDPVEGDGVMRFVMLRLGVRRICVAFATASFLIGPVSAAPRPHGIAGQDPTDSNGVIPPGVSDIQFPLTPGEIAGVPGLAVDTATPPPQAPAGFLAAHRGMASVRAGRGALTALTGADYQWCSANGDTPPPAVASLAGALGGRWQNIYQYVHNNIDLEPGAESSKGPLGTYLDQSGTSFDQASLLIAMLRASGYQAQFMVGTIKYTAANLGILSLSSQLAADAGAASDGTTPYAWVQVMIGGSWVTLDPANKTYNILGGTDLTKWLPATTPTDPAQYTQGLIQANDINPIANVYNAFNAPGSFPNTVTGSVAALIGGHRIIQDFTTTPSTRSGGTAYANLPQSYRTGIAFSSAGVSQIYICTDQVYGHTLAFHGTASYIDGNQLQTGFADPVSVEIWHPTAGGFWSQTALQTLTTVNNVVALSFGHVGKLRAQHDSDLQNYQGGANQAGTDQALVATASAQLGQTS